MVHYYRPSSIALKIMMTKLAARMHLARMLALSYGKPILRQLLDDHISKRVG